MQEEMAKEMPTGGSSRNLEWKFDKIGKRNEKG